MRRLLLLGILAVSGATACKDGGDAPAVQPGVAAGKVVEVSGAVTATRDGAKRTLTAPGEVSGDDVIETGADGHVVIVLGHNNARWELGRNQSVKVAASGAWTEPKREGVASSGDEATTTAGRHGEKMAASTGTTGAAPSPPAAPEPAPDPAAAPRDENAVDRNAARVEKKPSKDALAVGAGGGGHGGEERTKPRPALATKPVAPPVQKDRAPGGALPPPAPPPPPPPPPPQLQQQPGSMRRGPADKEASKVADDAVERAPAKATTAAPIPAVDPVVLRPLQTAMTACLAPGTSVTLTVTVRNDVVSVRYAGETPAKTVADCIAKAASAAKISKVDPATRASTLTLTKR